MILKGIDEDWSKVDPMQAYADGFRFVFGYVSQDVTGKNLSTVDVARIHAARMAVALVYEFDPQSALGGYDAGVRDAGIAIAHAQGLAAPPGVALYAAVDWNVTDAEKPSVLAYANGFSDACRAAGFRSGIYAGYWVCKYLADHTYVGFLWQTYAWSGGLWLATAAVRQTQNGVHEAGATVDLDESEIIDFGQWEDELAMTDSVGEPGFAPYSPDTARAVSVGAIGAGWVTGTLPGWDDELGTYNLKSVEERLTALVKGLSGGLTEEDHAAVKALTDAVNALNSRLASP